MKISPRVVVLAAAVALLVVACMQSARLPFTAGVGPDPRLPPPEKELIPRVKVAKAARWPAGTKPTSPDGRAVTAFATDLDHPRWLHVLPNGDVLVAEANQPPQPEELQKGIEAFIMRLVMQHAGAGVPSANRIRLLRDADGDGVAETREIFADNLFSPFGMALVGEDLYVANADGVVRFKYKPGATRAEGPATKVIALPGGPRNHHWTKSLIASRDGAKLYATVGSNSNIAEHGMGEEEGRAAIWEIDLKTGAGRRFATGLRNPNGMDWEPATGVLWTVVNERDKLGSDLVPDYLTSVREDGFYGWPWSYFGQNVDPRVQPPNPGMVAKAIKPDYALGTHVAPLGLAFGDGGAYVGQHGSWNRDPVSGYNVVFIRFAAGKPAGMPREVLTGFLGPDGEARGRPVGVALDKRGALLVADDVGNAVWRLAPVR